MKFFWKIYFSFIVLFLLSFGFFGTWMIQLSFDKAYQRELEEGESDNRMFQLAFEMNINTLDEVYKSEEMIPLTGSMATQNLSNTGIIYRIYNQAEKLLYESQPSGCRGDVLKHLNQLHGDPEFEELTCGWETVRYQGKSLLIFVCQSNVGGHTYYLESINDISDIYEDRENFYDWYVILMLILTAITTILVFIITHFLTRPISELSQTTRHFTEGDYEVRASEEGGDEFAELASDFNEMADTISEKIEELSLHAQRQEDFTASFAHELKTPLTSIIGYADMLRTIDCSEEERLEAVNYIFHQGKRLENLSLKLLELIVADKQEYNFRPLSVTRLIEETSRLTESKRNERSIQLIIDLEEGIIEGEKDLLISALSNFLDNARKAVPENGQIWIRGKQYAGCYLLCIADNGCGMESSEVSRITEAFYMIDKSRARKEGGAGLGMTLCSRILSLHDVRWKIFSHPGKGTAICMQFGTREVEDDA